MQCNAPCLYQVCEAGSNGSWCGRGPRVLLCSRVEPGHLRWVRPAMAQRLRPTKRVLASVSVSLSHFHFKSQPQTITDWEKDHGGDESTTTLDQIITYGSGSAFVQWTDLLQINKSTCKKNDSYAVYFLSFFVFLVKTMMLHYLACFGGCRIVFLSHFLVLFRLKCVTPLLLKTAG